MTTPYYAEETLTVGSLCSGYEGLSMGLRLAGLPIRLAFVADPDPAARRLLAYRHAGVPNLGDITTVDWSAVPQVDILTAGFPCQDVSLAGRRAGLAPGTRTGIWTSVATAIAALQPKIVLLENVRGLLSARAHSEVEPCPWCLGDDPDESALRALGAVLGDLADLGFDAEWVSLPASAVGAPHRRERVFVLAWPANAPGIGYGNDGAQGFGGVPTAVVSGGFGADGLSLLPTPAARLGDGRGAPDAGLAADRFDAGRRNLDDAVALLPTPAARDGDGRGEGSPDYWHRRRHELGRDNGVPPGAAVTLLPTPRATDGTKGGPNQRGSSGDMMLPSAVMLLPTPTATPYGNNQSPSAGAAVPPSLDSLAAGGNLLPTPTAHDTGRSPEDYQAMRASMDGGPRSSVSSLTVAAQLLPTPRASDGAKGGPNQRGTSGDMMLLPTPTVADMKGTLTTPGSLTHIGGNPTLLGAIADRDRWGQYADAIARWETVIGRPAPDPTEPGAKGQPRLSPRFVEWLMGLPEGHVTGLVNAADPDHKISRNDALRLLGNGVVPQQCAAAVAELLNHLSTPARAA